MEIGDVAPRWPTSDVLYLSLDPEREGTASQAERTSPYTVGCGYLLSLNRSHGSTSHVSSAALFLLRSRICYSRTAYYGEKFM